MRQCVRVIFGRTHVLILALKSRIAAISLDANLHVDTHDQLSDASTHIYQDLLQVYVSDQFATMNPEISI